MPSRIITPPDHVGTKQNILVINATQNDLTTLILWLKTIPDQFDIHVYHNQMPDTEWTLTVAETAATILVSKPNQPDLKPEIAKMIEFFSNRVVFFGINTDYPDLIQYFLTKKELV